MSAVMQDWIPRHRLTVDEYYRMAEADEFPPYARVELIDGEVVYMPPIGSRHAAMDEWIRDRLMEAFGGAAQVRSGQPVRLDSYSEPEPDLAVVTRRDDYYRDAHPTGADVLLLVEVSETTLSRDLRLKVPLYARFQIPELWIVEPSAKRIHFFRQPDAGRYTDISMAEKPGVTPLSRLPTVRVDLANLFE
jgi:Uma2 family endonuclease